MSKKFVITQTEKETKNGKTITIEMKRECKTSSTIDGNIDEVIEKLKECGDKK